MKKSFLCTMFRSQTLRISVHIMLCFHIATGNEIQDNGGNLDIIRVLNTSQPYWLYWETEANSFRVCLEEGDKSCISEVETCIRIIKRDISNQEYNFTEVTLLNGTKVENKFRGIFVNDTEPPKSMRVYEVDDPSLNDSVSGLYTLQYADDPDPECIVFFVNDLGPEIQDDGRTCEMYLRGSSVDTGPSISCQTFFNSSCKAAKEADVAVGPFSLKVDYLRFLYAAEAHIYEDVPMLSAMRRPYLTGGFSSTDSFPPMLSGLDSYRALHDRIVSMRGELPQSVIYSERTLRQVVAGEVIIIMDATGNRVFVAPFCDALQPAFFHVSRQRVETADFRWYMNKRLDPRLVTAMDRRIRWLQEAAVPFMLPHEIFRKPATCFLDHSGGSGGRSAAGQYEVLHLEDLREIQLNRPLTHTERQSVRNL
ncbi:hypothetical protein V5799_008825 [Amblyomma americanum]|uniref:Secreted protein n=1 Tax=Amblyomma americanum TaxID=6943 RepID=A0AAQ4FBX5_AMBAM